MKLEIWAEKLKAMGHPVRLDILVRLFEGRYDLKKSWKSTECLSPQYHSTYQYSEDWGS